MRARWSLFRRFHPGSPACSPPMSLSWVVNGAHPQQLWAQTLFPTLLWWGWWTRTHCHFTRTGAYFYDMGGMGHASWHVHSMVNVLTLKGALGGPWLLNLSPAHQSACTHTNTHTHEHHLYTISIFCNLPFGSLPTAHVRWITCHGSCDILKPL